LDGANYFETITFVQKSYKIQKKPQFFSSSENAPLMGWKDPQEELSLDAKLREFFS
jgi:hypothetical protein